MHLYNIKSLKKLRLPIVRFKTGLKLLSVPEVTNEVCVNLVKKLSLPEVQIRRLIVAFYQKCHDIVELNQETLLKSSQLREQYHFSVWDSLIIATALQGGAVQFYSEDMQNGLLVEQKMTIINPFASLVSSS